MGSQAEPGNQKPNIQPTSLLGPTGAPSFSQSHRDGAKRNTGLQTEPPGIASFRSFRTTLQRQQINLTYYGADGTAATVAGIYEIEGDVLTICVRRSSGEISRRPAYFGERGADLVRFGHTRQLDAAAVETIACLQHALKHGFSSIRIRPTEPRQERRQPVEPQEPVSNETLMEITRQANESIRQQSDPLVEVTQSANEAIQQRTRPLPGPRTAFVETPAPEIIRT